jgi:hypothetical protein
MADHATGSAFEINDYEVSVASLGIDHRDEPAGFDVSHHLDGAFRGTGPPCDEVPIWIGINDGDEGAAFREHSAEEQSGCRLTDTPLRIDGDDNRHWRTSGVT